MLLQFNIKEMNSTSIFVDKSFMMLHVCKMKNMVNVGLYDEIYPNSCKSCLINTNK